MKEIKFRAWDEKLREFEDKWDIGEFHVGQFISCPKISKYIKDLVDKMEAEKKRGLK